MGKRDARVVGGGSMGALEMPQGFNDGVREPLKHRVLVLGRNSNSLVFGSWFLTTNPMLSFVSWQGWTWQQDERLWSWQQCERGFVTGRE